MTFLTPDKPPNAVLKPHISLNLITGTALLNPGWAELGDAYYTELGINLKQFGQDDLHGTHERLGRYTDTSPTVDFSVRFGRSSRGLRKRAAQFDIERAPKLWRVTIKHYSSDLL